MVKLYTAALLGVAMLSTSNGVAAVQVSQAERAKSGLALILAHKHRQQNHQKQKHKTPEDDQQALYEQQVLEAAQKDPELMAALQSAAQEAADGKSAASEKLLDRAEGLVDAAVGNLKQQAQADDADADF